MAKASLIVFATLSVAFICCCQANLVSKVCSQASNPPLCTQAFKSDPRSRGADIRGLGQIIIKKAKTATRAAISTAKSVGGRKYKQIVDTCVETCNYAIGDLNVSSQLLKKSDERSIGDLLTRASAAGTNVGTCDDEFGRREPDKIKNASQRARDLIDVLLVIAHTLE